MVPNKRHRSSITGGVGKPEVGCGSPAWRLLAAPPCSPEGHFLRQEEGSWQMLVGPQACSTHSRLPLAVSLACTGHLPPEIRVPSSPLWEGAPQSVGHVFSLRAGEQGTHWPGQREPQGPKLVSLLSVILRLKLALSRRCIMRNIFLSLWACHPWASLRL